MRLNNLISIFIFLFLLGIIFYSSQQLSEAKGDQVLEEISKYKNWHQVHKTDEKIANGAFRITNSLASG
jgi:hypothetical protein